jgi:hypothetical protein
MKLIFILIPIFSFVEIRDPIFSIKNDTRLIQNTNLNFDKIDFSKLEISFLQVGCFNHDNYVMKFNKAENGFNIKVYEFSSNNCKNLKFKKEGIGQLLASKFIKNEDLVQIKDILKTDQTKISTMFNVISIKYNGEVYSFQDMSPAPKWKNFVYSIINSTDYVL